MSLLRAALATIRALFRRNVVADEIRDEMQFHVEMRAAEYQRQGVAPGEARRRASKQFGNLAVMQDRGYDVRGGGVMETVAQDARYGARVLTRQPIVTAAVVLTLAIAIAANTALFSIFDGLLFRPLPYRSPETIVHIEQSASLPPLARWELDRALHNTPLLADRSPVAQGGPFEEDVQVIADLGLVPVGVTASFFDLLGVRPLYGRAFTAEEVVASGPKPIVLGYDLWQSRFGGDPGVLNRVIEIPSTVFRNAWVVVGIMPRGFDFPRGSNLWAPGARASNPIAMSQFARLADGATIDMLRREFPDAVFTPLRDYVRPRGAAAFAYLLGATSLLLVVAWVQIAALLFARALARTREIGVRLTLGATNGRLIRQFATEAALVAGAAFLLGWLLAAPLTSVVVRLLPSELTAGQMLTPDVRTLLFTCAVSLIGLVMLVLLPAGLVRRTPTAALLHGMVPGTTRGSVGRVRAGLTMAQIAMTTALLYMAGLAIHSFSGVSNAPVGFDVSRLIAARLPPVVVASVPPATPGTSPSTPGAPGAPPQPSLPGTPPSPAGAPPAPPGMNVADLQRQTRLYAEVVDAVRAVPGVLSATAAQRRPLQADTPRTWMVTSKADASGTQIEALVANVATDFSRTLGLPLIDGRDVTAADLAGSAVATPSVRGVLVNRTLARSLEPLGSVPGQIITVGSTDYRILGVVGDFADLRPDQAARPHVFVPTLTSLIPILIARLDANVPDAEAGVRATLDRLWPDRPSRRIIRLEDEHARTTADYRARSILLTLLGVLCLPLAIVGLIASQMETVRHQTRDIAIRLALGAESSDVRRRVVRRALVVIVAGLAMGLAGGVGVGRLMSSYLYGVDALDPVSVGLVAALLLGIGCLATLWPANRAASIAPASVLRDQ